MRVWVVYRSDAGSPEQGPISPHCETVGISLQSGKYVARRTHAEVHAGPLEWLQQQRIARAQELLERTDASVEQIAASCGMGTAATLRRHFHRTLGVSPTAYRATYGA